MKSENAQLRAEVEVQAQKLDSAKKEIEKLSEKYGDAGLRLLFEIQEECQEAMIASGLKMGAEILLKNYKDMKLQNRELLDTLELLTAKLESEGETHPFVGLARGVVTKYTEKK